MTDFTERLTALRSSLELAQRDQARVEAREESLKERAIALRDQLQAEGTTHKELDDLIAQVEEELETSLKKLEEAVASA